MLKVLEVPAFGIHGGIYQYIFTHLKYMNKDDMQIDFLTRNKELLNNEIIKKNNYGVKLFTGTDRDNKEILIEEINKILDEEYDVVHLHSAYLLGLTIEEIAIKRNVKKVILHSHSTNMEFFGGKGKKELYKLHEKNKKKLSNEYATDFWACSKKAAKWLFNEQIENIKIMNNAIEVEKFIFNAKKRKNIRKKYNLENKNLLGHVGRFGYQKNQEFLVDVFEEVCKKDDRFILMLVGDGNDFEKIKSKIVEKKLENKVILTGWLDNVEDYLNAMDLFLLPSRFEGLPISVIEVQSNGLKSIISSEITKETDITGNVEFLPLINEEWVNKIIKYDYKYTRKDMMKIITDKGYNIYNQVKIIENEYRS